jgi:hypothetical protein
MFFYLLTNLSSKKWKDLLLLLLKNNVNAKFLKKHDGYEFSFLFVFAIAKIERTTIYLQ